MTSEMELEARWRLVDTILVRIASFNRGKEMKYLTYFSVRRIMMLHVMNKFLNCFINWLEATKKARNGNTLKITMDSHCTESFIFHR